MGNYLKWETEQEGCLASEHLTCIKVYHEGKLTKEVLNVCAFLFCQIFH